MEVIQFEGIKQALTSDITVVRREMDSVRYADLKRRNTELQTSLTDILHPNYDKEEDSENGNESDNEEKGDVRKEKKERLDHSLFDMQKLHFISGTAIELINLNIQVQCNAHLVCPPWLLLFLFLSLLHTPCLSLSLSHTHIYIYIYSLSHPLSLSLTHTQARKRV